jgi:hypothetical protein
MMADLPDPVKEMTMKQGSVSWCAAAAAVLLLTLSSCMEYQEPELPALRAGEINAQVLWQRMTVETDYTRYEYWPEHEGMRLGQSPHGAFHRIFVNNALITGLPSEDRKAPEGSIIVKENYDIDENLMALTIMAKVPGFDPENGDWFWARYSPDGEILAEGSLMGCITCHAGAAFNDYVIVGNLRRDPDAGP